MQIGDVMDAKDHVEHCDVLITVCLHTIDGRTALGLAIDTNEDLSPLELIAMAEGLKAMAAQVYGMAQAKAEAN